MKNLLKAELLKFKKDYFIWGICIVLIICASFSILTDVYISVENALLCLGKDYMVLLLSFAIYAGFTLTDEFSNRTIIHIITCGNKRLACHLPSASDNSGEACPFWLPASVILLPLPVSAGLPQNAVEDTFPQS